RRAILGIEHTPFADTVVRWSGRVAQGLGAIVDVLVLIDDLAKWDAGRDAKVRVLGDVVALGSAALILVGSGPAGAFVGLVALGIHLLADFLGNMDREEQERRDFDTCLGAVGFSPALVDTVLRADADQVGILVRDVGLLPKHLQWLASTCPE